MVNSLSGYEMNLITDAQIIHAKNKIIQKVCESFGELAEAYQDCLKTTPGFFNTETHPKISRGENYKGLPYVVLDYPRQFGKVDVFAIRTLFWWGNFFSITLQLGGEYQQRYSVALEKAIDEDRFGGWFIGCSTDPWEYHFESNNYAPIARGNNYNICKLSYLKIAKKIPLSKWDDSDYFFKEKFNFLIEVLNA